MARSHLLVVPENPLEIHNHIPVFGKHLVWWKGPRNELIGGLTHIEEHNLLLLPMRLSMVGEHIGI